MVKTVLGRARSLVLLVSLVVGTVGAVLVPSASAVCRRDGDCVVCQILLAIDNHICTFSSWSCDNGDMGDRVSCT